jgi:XTP/dITP diphosphohydrolase
MILEAPRGSGGFGYDPLFLVPEYGKTLAELALDFKNGISHRGKALEKLRKFLSSEQGRPGVENFLALRRPA